MRNDDGDRCTREAAGREVRPPLYLHDAAAAVATAVTLGTVLVLGAWAAERSRAVEVLSLGALALFAFWLVKPAYERAWRGPGVAESGLFVGSYWRVHKATDVALTVVGLWACQMVALAFASFVFAPDQFATGAARSTDSRAYFNAIGLYTWHGLDALPFVKAPETLRWSEPIQDRGAVVGALLVLYKALVLAPLLAVARTGWRPGEAVAQTGSQVSHPAGASCSRKV